MIKAEEERQRAQARIAGALEQQKNLLQQQRENFHERQARNAEKRAQYEKLQRAEIERRQQEALDKKDALQRAFQKMEMVEEKKKKMTIDKEKEQERNLARIREEEAIQHKRRMERTKLKQADKKEAVGKRSSLACQARCALRSLKKWSNVPTERLYRMREYERQVAVQRLQDDDVRTTALADFKAKMLEERKAFRRQNDMERYRVIQSMEKMRKNPAKAVKGELHPGTSVNW